MSLAREYYPGVTIENGKIYGKDSDVYRLLSSYLNISDDSKFRFSFQAKWSSKTIETTYIFINEGKITQNLPSFDIQKIISNTTSTFDGANGNTIDLLTTERIEANERSTDAVISRQLLYATKPLNTISAPSNYTIDKQYHYGKNAVTYGNENLPLLRTYFKEDWYLDELKLHNIDPASLGISLGASGTTSSTTTATALKASDFLATLDPAAIAGIASAKELFSANQIAIAASSWSGSLTINLVAVASNVGDILTGKQVDTNSGISTGSILVGGLGNDQLWGKAGWDIIDGGAGNDLIRGGNGRDILTGGAGSDEVHGDFGWNTYKSEIDGFSDLIALKSDQYLVNWIYGKAGNNSDGSKCDIIEGLDAIDKIRIIGVDTSDITFAANVTAKGLTGIGIYGKGALEALYTGGNLTLAQIQGMTSGDASAAAMANSISSYGWTQNPGTFVAS